ncbi:MAG: hypothetical protein CL701_06425 [Chloroflexi bacterium]|nr:hypothetical protein [Chloroflexota bacterium]|tara:strand:+ start:344 stop:583 length:240 start_codon:yes stop_codon:yes gene_type:complete
MGVKDNFIYEECMKELDTMFKEKTSFGKYFDDQRDRLEKAMQDKNKQLNVEWMERYEKRKAERIRISDTSEDELPETTR